MHIQKYLAFPLLFVLVAGNAALSQTSTAMPPASGTMAPPVTQTAAAPASAAMPDASGKYKLREGEEVNLRFAEDLTSKVAKEGDPVTLTLVDDLKVGGVVVAKAGLKALGEITNSKRAGMMGKAGELNMRLDYIKVGDDKIRLRGTKGKEGESGQTGAIVLTVLFGPIGLIKHGKEVEIKQGTALKAYVADDVALLPVAI